MDDQEIIKLLKSQKNPANVVFSNSGVYPVTLMVNENGCSKSYTDSVHLYANPVAKFGLASAVSCSSCLRNSFTSLMGIM